MSHREITLIPRFGKLDALKYAFEEPLPYRCYIAVLSPALTMDSRFADEIVDLTVKRKEFVRHCGDCVMYIEIAAHKDNYQI